MSDRPPALTQQQLNRLLRVSDISGLMKAVAGSTKEYVESIVAPLQTRIAELEARPAVKYLGVWQQNKSYRAGSMVTDQGSVWHCERATLARPGSSDDWILAVKRGRDGKDASLKSGAR